MFLKEDGGYSEYYDGAWILDIVYLFPQIQYSFNMNLNNILGIYTRVAQWIRHRSSKARTAGSSPAVGIFFITYILCYKNIKLLQIL